MCTFFFFLQAIYTPFSHQYMNWKIVGMGLDYVNVTYCASCEEQTHSCRGHFECLQANHNVPVKPIYTFDILFETNKTIW